MIPPLRGRSNARRRPIPILARAALRIALGLALAAVLGAGPPPAGSGSDAAGARAADRAAPARVAKRPNVLLVSIDTLRVDHVSGYGYARNTTPNLDARIAAGVRFDLARTVEPLTNPALSSMITSRHPHHHGGSRNGIRVHEGLTSVPKAFADGGYRTAAFVGNWTLRDKLSGLAEHFQEYEEVLTRARWLGLIRSEATAEDLTESALAWLADRRDSGDGRPYMLWVHYVEPHAPYRARKEFLKQLGIPRSSNLSAEERYDTEIAYVDRSIGELFAGMKQLGADRDTIVAFFSDHGESLGEHDYWGHGRHLYEPTLRIPLSITWPGTLEPRTVGLPALLIDVGPTLLGLAGVDGRPEFEGYDWAPYLRGAAAPVDRVTHYQAHKGAVLGDHDSDIARKAGLLEVGTIRREFKEIFRIPNNRRQTFDLAADPAEVDNLSRVKENPTEGLQEWMRLVYEGLGSFDDDPPEPLDDEAAEVMRSLGYVD